jgi:Synaptobrevin
MYFCCTTQTNRMTLIKSQLGHWYVKGCQQDLIYIVATSPLYPMDIASECLDELHELHQQAMGKFRPQKRKQAEDACCMTIAIKYGTLDESSAAHVLMTEIEPEVRSQYSKSIRNLMDEADEIKEEMNNNILALLNQVEKIERLEALSADLEQQAMVFKKRAKKLKWSTSWDNSVFLGTAVVTLAGGIVGFLAGGPGGAAVLTPMASVAAAEATETIVLAVAAGAGYLGAQSAMKSWFATQKFIPV